MKLSEVLNVFADLEDYIEGITYDGDPNSFTLSVGYPSEEIDEYGIPDYFMIDIHLFYPDEKGFVEFIENDDKYISFDAIKYINEIIEKWEKFVNSQLD